MKHLKTIFLIPVLLLALYLLGNALASRLVLVLIKKAVLKAVALLRPNAASPFGEWLETAWEAVFDD